MLTSQEDTISQLQRQLALEREARLALEADLQCSNAKLKELDQLKSEFLNTISHELRTPLTSIKAFAEILVDSQGEDPETQMEFLGIINKEAERLSRLINNLLDISRIEAGRLHCHFESCDLNTLVNHACETLRLSAKKKSVEYRLSLHPDSLPVQADEDRMVQVVTNLIGNALKFTPTGGTVQISTDRMGEDAQVLVKDNGSGIAIENHQRIFEKFGQVDTSETREFKGSGLGLPIARSIVEAHRGILTVDSELGSGSSFTVRLPLER